LKHTEDRVQKLQALRDHETRTGTKPLMLEPGTGTSTTIVQQMLATAKSARDEVHSLSLSSLPSPSLPMLGDLSWETEEETRREKEEKARMQGYWNDRMQEKLGELTREHKIAMDKVHAMLQKVVVQQEEQTVILQHIEEAMTAVQQGVAATRKLVRVCDVVFCCCRCCFSEKCSSSS
jgi:hypothetical protein